MACKNGAVSETISKKYCDELSGSMNWFAEQYDPQCSAIPIMVHPSSVLDDKASPPGNMRVIDTEKLESLKNAVRSLMKTVVLLRDFADHERINQALTEYKLTADSLILAYTTEYRRLGR